jgi:hypothetical protein
VRFRGTVILLRAVKAAKAVVTTHKLGYTLLIAVAVVVGSGLLVAILEESDPERNIQSVPDALWWAVQTMTTVGHGDLFPVTAAGRAVGAVAMVLGIGLFGLLAATLASFLVEKDLEKKEIDPQFRSMSGYRGSRRCLAISSQPLLRRIWTELPITVGLNCQRGDPKDGGAHRPHQWPISFWSERVR